MSVSTASIVSYYTRRATNYFTWRITFLTKVYLVVRQNVSWLIQSSVTTTVMTPLCMLIDQFILLMSKNMLQHCSTVYCPGLWCWASSPSPPSRSWITRSGWWSGNNRFCVHCTDSTSVLRRMEDGGDGLQLVEVVAGEEVAQPQQVRTGFAYSTQCTVVQ